MKSQSNRKINCSPLDIEWQGECPKFAQSATLLIHLSVKRGCKYDLQPTFTPHIKECNLLRERNDKNTVCMLSCPNFEAYKNSHS